MPLPSVSSNSIEIFEAALKSWREIQRNQKSLKILQVPNKVNQMVKIRKCFFFSKYIFAVTSVLRIFGDIFI